MMYTSRSQISLVKSILLVVIILAASTDDEASLSVPASKYNGNGFSIVVSVQARDYGGLEVALAGSCSDVGITFWVC